MGGGVLMISAYNTMPFTDLFHEIFDCDGHIKPCGREACQVLIERLESVYGETGTFGNRKTGFLNMSYAYDAAKYLL